MKRKYPIPSQEVNKDTEERKKKKTCGDGKDPHEPMNKTNKDKGEKIKLTIDVNKNSVLLKRSKLISILWECKQNQITENKKKKKEEKDEEEGVFEMMIVIETEAKNEEELKKMWNFYLAGTREEFPTYMSLSTSVDFNYLVSLLSLVDQLEDEDMLKKLLYPFVRRLSYELADATESLLYEYFVQKHERKISRDRNQEQTSVPGSSSFTPLLSAISGVNIGKIKEIVTLAYRWNLFPYMWNAFHILCSTSTLPIPDLLKDVPSQIGDLYMEHLAERSRNGIPSWTLFHPGQVVACSYDPYRLDSSGRGYELAIVTEVHKDEGFSVWYIRDASRRNHLHGNCSCGFQPISKASIDALTPETDQMLVRELKPGFLRRSIQYIL